MCKSISKTIPSKTVDTEKVKKLPNRINDNDGTTILKNRHLATFVVYLAKSLSSSSLICSLKIGSKHNISCLAKHGFPGLF